MRACSLPPLGARYWAAISAASVFGANLGDFMSHDLHLGHWHGLLPLSAAFALILLVERTTSIVSQAFYWLAVVVVRAAATNIADLATHDMQFGSLQVICGLLVLLLLTASIGAMSARASGLDTNGLYWISLFLAGAAGTVIGDDVSGHLGVAGASAVLTTVLAGAFWLRHADHRSGKASYWTTMLGARSAGTCVGDFIADGAGLGLGIPGSTAASGILLLGLLALQTPGNLRKIEMLRRR